MPDSSGQKTFLWNTDLRKHAIHFSKKILWIGKGTPQLPHFTQTKIANVFYAVQISDKIIANCSQKLQIL